MLRTETLEQSVLDEGSIVRPEVADMSERHHEQTCFKLSARPMPDIDIVHNADVSIDINTDRPKNSAPRNNSDVNLFKRNAPDTHEGRPMEGITKSCQEELSGFELAVAGTDKEQLPTSYSLEQSESIISESQNFMKNTEEMQFSYNTGLSSQELEDAIRREVLRNRLVGQVNMTDADSSLDQLRSEGLRRWNMDMDMEYQYEIFNGLPVYYSGDRYDSDDTDEFIPNDLDGMEYMMCTQRRPDGGDNRGVTAVNMTPMCRTVYKVARREADESSDASRTDTGDLDDTDCKLETDVWDDTYRPVWISGSRMVDSSSQASQELSSNRDVACMGDFVMRILMTLGLIRVWAPGWSPNGTHGMVHVHGNPKNSHRTQLRLFRRGRQRRWCVTGMIRNLRKRMSVAPTFTLLTVRQDIWMVPGVLFDCVCCDSRADGTWASGVLKHISTIAWYMDVADSSYIVVCYECLWLIDHSQVLISLFYDRIVRFLMCFLTEFQGLRCGRMLNGTMSAGGRQCSCACLTGSIGLNFKCGCKRLPETATWTRIPC